jgi:serine/threonine-protein kinase
MRAYSAPNGSRRVRWIAKGILRAARSGRLWPGPNAPGETLSPARKSASGIVLASFSPGDIGLPSREVISGAKALVGRTVRGKWRLDALLGVGGSAAVYAATHRNGKRGALKILRRDLAYDGELRERFLREGYVANLVGHPGVVAMLDDDIDDDGSPFLVMELLDGSTLERVLRKRKSMPLRDVLRIAESVLDVLAAAHAQGIVHGDIKPANVFLTKGGEVKLLDFGIARFTEGSQVHGVALGTPAYMSPEQARGDSVDGRTDLWALGGLMFALITGQRPREAASAGEELVMAQDEPMRKLSDLAPDLSRELAEVVDRALTFDRGLRWPDALTMQQALRLALLLEQASGPPEQGLQVPLPLATNRDERTTVDAFRPTRGARARGSDRRLSTLPPGPTTGHMLAFAASVPPPSQPSPRASRAPEPRRPRRALLSAALLVLGLGLGVLSMAPFFADATSSYASPAANDAPAASHDAGALDATADATGR